MIIFPAMDLYNGDIVKRDRFGESFESLAEGVFASVEWALGHFR